MTLLKDKTSHIKKNNLNEKFGKIRGWNQILIKRSSKMIPFCWNDPWTISLFGRAYTNLIQHFTAIMVTCSVSTQSRNSSKINEWNWKLLGSYLIFMGLYSKSGCLGLSPVFGLMCHRGVSYCSWGGAAVSVRGLVMTADGAWPSVC